MINYNHLSIPEATELQRTLRDEVKLTPWKGPIRYVGGADISFNKFSTTVYAGIVLLEFPSLKLVDASLVKKEVLFPYVPGYLAFREVPALLDAWNQLSQKPDILVVDGHGIAHPRRLGIASHFGVLTGQATIGSAKKKLFGQYEEPGIAQGNHTLLTDKEGQQLGYVLRSKQKVKPIFISPGHLTSFADSLQLISQCLKGYRLPEPTRLAHNKVNEFRKAH
ncbi:deoxyribonuclease V [Chitinophaga sp. 212800010-3]|uniref:deoxyribonuclease V n=1 Tax=unclassified Chitinophaga TaxID=2619133 RepID=UPI002DE2F99A|nr:deoxyribonuclease V [Chitinophaga sp. 212800010-3]MEC5144616.1 Endonuclease V [Chitinophaga sp. 212800010-3]